MLYRGPAVNYCQGLTQLVWMYLAGVYGGARGEVGGTPLLRPGVFFFYHRCDGRKIAVWKREWKRRISSITRLCVSVHVAKVLMMRSLWGISFWSSVFVVCHYCSYQMPDMEAKLFSSEPFLLEQRHKPHPIWTGTFLYPLGCSTES